MGLTAEQLCQEARILPEGTPDDKIAAVHTVLSVRHRREAYR